MKRASQTQSLRFLGPQIFRERRLASPCTFSTFRLGLAGQGYTYVAGLREYETNFVYALQLEDLYVKSEHRNKGIGKALFKELAIIAQEKVTDLTPLFDHAN